MKRKDNSVINSIAHALVRHPGLTGAELSKEIGDPNAYRRLSELKKLGLARKEGQRRCAVTNKMAHVWYPDDAQPEPERGEETPYQEIQRLKGRIAWLEKRDAAFDAMKACLEKFVEKVESGRARSVTTYMEAKAALALVNEK